MHGLRLVLVAALFAALGLLAQTANRLASARQKTAEPEANFPAPPPLLALFASTNRPSDRGRLSLGPYNLRDLATLTLDARTKTNGRVWMEILQPDGQPVAGFAEKDFWGGSGNPGDGAHGDFPLKTPLVAKWGGKGSNSLANLPENSSTGKKNYLIRIRLAEAEVFSCGFAP